MSDNGFIFLGLVGFMAWLWWRQSGSKPGGPSDSATNIQIGKIGSDYTIEQGLGGTVKTSGNSYDTGGGGTADSVGGLISGYSFTSNVGTGTKTKQPQ